MYLKNDAGSIIQVLPTTGNAELQACMNLPSYSKILVSGRINFGGRLVHPQLVSGFSSRSVPTNVIITLFLMSEEKKSISSKCG